MEQLVQLGVGDEAGEARPGLTAHAADLGAHGLGARAGAQHHELQAGDALARGRDGGGQDLDALVGDVASDVEHVGRSGGGSGGRHLDRPVDEPGLTWGARRRPSRRRRVAVSCEWHVASGVTAIAARWRTHAIVPVTAPEYSIH